jgi:HAD superfamily hydrolase (TIGR01509 family)
MSIKAILFDMDGVLIDAREWHYEALNRALGLFGYKISRSDHLEAYDGLPTARKLDMLSAEHDLPRQLHKFLNKMKQIYTMDIVHRSCRPVFQHQYALSRLKGDGFRIAVCSNSIRSTVESMLDYARLIEYVDFIVSNEDVQRPKPDPEMYLAAMKHFAVSPEEALIVEDNPIGVKAALASGARVMQVYDPKDVRYLKILESVAAGKS